MKIKILLNLCVCRFGFFFSFLFFVVLEFDVCLLVFVLLMATINRRGRYPRFISLRMHGVQSVAVIIDFIYGQSIFFKSCDCRSEGVIPANTYIDKVVRKKKYKQTIFHKKICIRR